MDSRLVHLVNKLIERGAIDIMKIVVVEEVIQEAYNMGKRDKIDELFYGQQKIAGEVLGKLVGRDL
jgi:hypothetical protein